MKSATVYVWLLWGVLCCIPEGTKAQADTVVLSLDTVTVVARRSLSPLRGNANATLRWEMTMMHDLPKILGNADPVRYAQLLPGVQTCSEYNSGLYIQGCDNAHNLVAIEGVPVYHAPHLLGLFSIFNASHFPRMNFSKTIQESALSNRLGGMLNMQLPDEVPSRVNGEYTVGPMSSQGSLWLPLGRKSALFISLRAAYLNLLYEKWLQVEGNEMAYDFSDYNLTYLCEWGERNRMKCDFYYGYDKAEYDEVSYQARTALKWGNLKFSTHWEHLFGNGSRLNQTAYLTRYHNRLTLRQEALDFSLPSYITDIGYRSVWEWEGLRLGGDWVYHDIQPQKPNVGGTYHVQEDVQPKQRTWETAIHADYYRQLSYLWQLKLGARLTYYQTKGKGFASFDPQLTLVHSSPEYGNLSFSWRVQHQYLFQEGFSEMGLPTEFWFSADKTFAPQLAQSLSLAYDLLLQDGAWHLYVEEYYKRLRNQVEYKGNLFDFLNSAYSLEGSLLKGKGENYGVNVMLNKKSGPLTGWVSYTWGRAFRRFGHEDYAHRYPASHERIHELNAVLTCHVGKRWSVGQHRCLHPVRPIPPLSVSI